MRQKRKAMLKRSVDKNLEQNDSAKKKSTSKRRLRNRLIIIFAAILLVFVTATLLIIYTNPFRSTPRNLTITIAWNPRSTADDVARVMARELNSSVHLKNVTGANGANGANEVFRSAHNGGNILSTNLSAFVTSEAMGFAESSQRDWDAWLCAFAPAVVVVKSDSHFRTIGSLIETIYEYPSVVRCADDGYGTISYIAAELFSSQIALELSHQSFSGSSSAINALLEYQADFAILLSTQAKELLRSGELRALGVFSNDSFTLTGEVDIIIPSVSGFSDRFDRSLPFGEYYGFFIPKNTPNATLSGYDSMFANAVSSETFIEFTRSSGLEIISPDRELSNDIVEHICSVTNWTLYDAGFLPTNPDTLGIPKP